MDYINTGIARAQIEYYTVVDAIWGWFHHKNVALKSQYRAHLSTTWHIVIM